MFKDFAENTGEGDRSVICSRCFITFFEDEADLGSTLEQYAKNLGGKSKKKFH